MPRLSDFGLLPETAATGTERLLSLPHTMILTGMSKSTIYDAMRRRAFPRPLRRAGRSVAWRYSDVQRWLASRTAAHKAA